MVMLKILFQEVQNVPGSPRGTCEHQADQGDLILQEGLSGKNKRRAHLPGGGQSSIKQRLLHLLPMDDCPPSHTGRGEAVCFFPAHM